MRKNTRVSFNMPLPLVQWLLFLALLYGCAATAPEEPLIVSPSPPIEESKKEEESKKKHPQTVQVGRASWYGAKFHSQKTASGELFDRNDLTATHRTLPIGSRVKVTNLDNEKSVEVVINDRGPFAHGRIIDLSHAAARAIDILKEGVSKVRVEVLSLPESTGVISNSTSKKPQP